MNYGSHFDLGWGLKVICCRCQSHNYFLNVSIKLLIWLKCMFGVCAEHSRIRADYCCRDWSSLLLEMWTWMKRFVHVCKIQTSKWKQSSLVFWRHMFYSGIKKRVLQTCKKLLKHIFLSYGLAMTKNIFFFELGNKIHIEHFHRGRAGICCKKGRCIQMHKTGGLPFSNMLLKFKSSGSTFKNCFLFIFLLVQLRLLTGTGLS